MTDAVTTVLGVRIPSASPPFLATVGFHVFAGLASVIAGAGAMLSRKGTPRHITFGGSYYWCLMALFISASVLAFVRWSEDYHLFILGSLASAAATVGRSAARWKWHGWPRLHIFGMASSYILMLTAFYVDNGKSLPVWRDLPPVAYWLLPAIAGVPIMIWALLRHSIVRRYRECG